MNQKHESKLIKTGIYSSTIFEMDVWLLCNDNVYTDREYQEQLDSDGRMDCEMSKELTGLFPTRERALSDLEMMSDDPFAADKELYCAFVRERAMYCMMNASDYLKEWTYNYCLLLDESLVRNYCEEENPFLGRPKDKIRFSHGDIVMVPDAYSAHWGIVWEVPPTEEQVRKIHDKMEKETGTSDYRLDWSDDSYIILTSDVGAASHEHVLAHRVLPAPLHAIPAFVERKLKEGLRKADEK
jgi:hypothetical protein